MRNFYGAKPEVRAANIPGRKEVYLLKSKKEERDFKKIIEKNKQKPKGLFWKVNGMEEKVRECGRVFFPYWLITYVYSREKGVFKRKTEDSQRDNLMVVDGVHGTPCSHKFHSMLPGLEKEIAPVTGKDIIIPPLSWDETIRHVNKEVAGSLKRINGLLTEAGELSRMVAPCCKILDELKGRAAFIRERIDTLAAGRQKKKVFKVSQDNGKVHLRNITGTSVDFIDIRDEIRHAIWSGKNRETDPVEVFIRQRLKPPDLRAMDEDTLRNLFAEVNMLVRDYEMQLGPYLGRIEEKRDESYAEKLRLRAAANLPESAETITRCISGELIFYPYRCIKYKRIDKKGKARSRWLLLDGVTGNIHKECWRVRDVVLECRNVDRIWI